MTKQITAAHTMVYIAQRETFHFVKHHIVRVWALPTLLSNSLWCNQRAKSIIRWSQHYRRCFLSRVYFFTPLHSVMFLLSIDPLASNNNISYNINFLLCSHHFSVTSSSSNKHLSSSLRYSLGWVVTSFSSKSQRRQMFSRPCPRDNATYTLNGVSSPLGGCAISTIVLLIPSENRQNTGRYT
jgi:hypothetical protein